MGLNTTLMICNDALGSIERDPHFQRRLCDAVLEVGGTPVEVSAGGFYRAALVLENHNSEYMVPVLVGGNTAQRIDMCSLDLRLNEGEGPQDYERRLLYRLAEKLGFKLVRKK